MCVLRMLPVPTKVNDVLSELLGQSSMDAVAEVLHVRSPSVQDHWLRVVRHLALRLCVHAQHVASLPDSLKQLFEAEVVFRGNRHNVGQLAEQVQLLDGDCVDFVQHVNDGHVYAVSLDHVNDIVWCSVRHLDEHVGVVNSVLLANRTDDLFVQQFLWICCESGYSNS